MAREQPVRKDQRPKREERDVADRIRGRKLWHPPAYDPEARKMGARVCYDKEDLRAINAWANGVASKTDQLRAYQFVMQIAALIDEETFHPGEGDVSNFLQGKRSVGLVIRKMTNLKPELFPDE